MTPEQAQHIVDKLTDAMHESTLTVAALANAFRHLSIAAPQPIKWVIYMRPEVYSRMLPMSRRKLQPYVRKAWRQHYGA